MSNQNDQNKSKFNRDIIIQDDILESNDPCQNSFEMMALYRSLYIIKRKFEIYKNQIMEIYRKYNINEIDIKDNINHYIINIDSFDAIALEIFENINLLIIQIYNPKDLYIANLYLNDKRKYNMINIFKTLKNYILKNNNFEKYNQIFYDKKIKPYIIEKDNNEEEEKIEEKNIVNKEEEEIFKPINQYNKYGKMIKHFSQILNENISNKHLEDFLNNENEINNKIENENLNISNNHYSKNNNTIYIEAFPFILGDFLQKSTIYGIIETNNDLSHELNILFDNEILEKINLYEKLEKERKYREKLNSSYGKELVKYLNEKERIKENIRVYEKILIEKKGNNQNLKLIQDMLEKLLAQKIWVEQKIDLLKEEDNFQNEQIYQNKILETKNNDFLKSTTSKHSNFIPILNKSNSTIQLNQDMRLSLRQFSPINKTNHNFSIKLIKNETKEEKYISSLKEIFYFYSNQHNNAGSSPLFSSIQEKKYNIDLSEFLKFCNEFSIAITKQKLTEIFKRNSSNFYIMNFNEFIKTIEELSEVLHQNKKKMLLKKISECQEKINLMEIKENNRILEEKNNNLFIEKNTGNKIKRNLEKNQFVYLTKRKKVDEEISKLKYQYDKLNKFTNNQIKDTFYELLGLNQKYIYKKKMKGFLIPFQIHDKTSRIPINSIDYKINNNLEIKRLLEFQKEEKEKFKLSKKIINDDLMYQNKLKLFQENNKKLELHAIDRQKENKYSNIMKKRIVETQLKEEEKKNKISWNSLNMKYNLRNEKQKNLINLNFSIDVDGKKNKQIKKNYSAVELNSNDKSYKLPIIN